MGTTEAFVEYGFCTLSRLMCASKPEVWSVRYFILTLMFFFLPDTFQALIQYPDVVTAQAAKLVSTDRSDGGISSATVPE